MSKKILNIEYFNGGLADSEREGIRGAFFFAKNLNIFSEPTNLTLMPEAVKESSTTVVDLVKWIVPGTPHDTNTYAIGDTDSVCISIMGCPGNYPLNQINYCGRRLLDCLWHQRQVCRLGENV